ncbi:hypothetical protein DUI87_17126 [Hirundo rustica rustica]|uniref:CST complex subunit CTC1 n=1 Tax=Hirundo rustica rustica TaxID=333673 RepID=A0A3M0K2Y8_HIRRU|nr:hypothetical protein DUI87_17126 [Hirundo rustica rustica]
MAAPGAAEQRWLRAARDFVRRALPGPDGQEPAALEAVLRCLRSAGGGTLPLGYSFVSISDLQQQQHIPCCSHLSWSTHEFKEWSHQGQGALPMQNTLPRTYLILVGYLADGRQENKEKLVDGCLYVKDNTGIIPCEKPSQMLWHRVFQLGHRYTITGLSMSSLKKSGHSMYVTGVSSCVLPYCAEQVREQPLKSAWQGESTQSSSFETAEQLSCSLQLGAEEERPSAAKESKIISYVGFVTKILSVQAGLFLLDDQVCLCLAYQPLLNSARGLRPGACVELINVHLLQKPLVSFPFTVLGACLSSMVVLKSFSRLSTPYQPVASPRNLCLQLLFRFNLGMPLYLWLVNLLETFEERFSCFFGRSRLLSSAHRNPGAAEKFLVPLLQAMVPDTEARDIYNEILSKIHQCPLQKHLTLNPPCQAPSLSVVCHVAEQKSWEGFSPSQLLSPLEAQHMGTQELNRRLAWSYCTLSAESFQPQLILLGVLRVSSRSSSLQLQDKSSKLPCVISHKDGSPFAQTALIGSLLQVENYQLVVERFLKTDFPSWEHLKNLEHVRKKKTSVYVQFYFEDVQVLHAAEGQIQKDLRSGNSSPMRKSKDGSTTSELETPETKMLKPEDPEADAGRDENCQEGQSSSRTTSCVSRLFLVIQKESLMSRNYQLPAEEAKEAQEQQRSFQATVQWLGRPRLWSHPRETGNLSELEETGCDGKEGVTQQEDLEVFDKLYFPPVPATFLSRPSCPLCLPVQDSWHLQHETWISCLPERQAGQKSRCALSFTGSLVSFCGEIVERTLCASPKNENPPVIAGLRKKRGTLLSRDHNVKLSVSAASGSPVVVDVYITATYLQHLWGLLPGAKILFQNLERKISRVLVEDGTGEAVVLCRNEHVAAVLGLSLLEWEAVQNCVQSRGTLCIQHGEAPGTGSLPASEHILATHSFLPQGLEESEDLVACYLRSLCRSPLICRPILLDFSLDRKPSKILQSAPPQLRNFRCGEMDFVSQVGPPPSLLCLKVEEVGQDALRYLNSQRMGRTSSSC